MTRRSHWYVTSCSVIQDALLDGQAIGLGGKSLIAFVDGRYPFQERSGFAYHKWLEARRNLLGYLLPRRRGKPLSTVDPDCLILAVGRDAGSRYEQAVLKKRMRMHEAGVAADDMTDEEVTAWKQT